MKKRSLLVLSSILLISACNSTKESSGSIGSSSQVIESSSSVIESSSQVIESSSSSVIESTTSKYDSYYLNMTEPSTYYMLLDKSLTGYEFRQSLSNIISQGYVAHSYTYNNTVLLESDLDPEVEGNVICFYTGRSLSNTYWNKEHVWAKSHGFPNESSHPYSDAHHLRPTLISTNSARGNLDFGEVSGKYSEDGYGNKWTSTVFEPRDEVKGDVARIMFYMATRYGFDGTYNLTLVDDEVTSTSTGNGKFGGLQTLLKWHYEDPVSESEIYRNNVIYDKYQKNRNPYIDHPEFVDLAYPNEFVDVEVNEAKVAEVIKAINGLPATITLEDEQTVQNVNLGYLSLNYKEKEQVTNYSILKNAIDTIEELKNVKVTYDYEYDLTKISGITSIYSSQKGSVDGANFTITKGGLWGDDGGGIRLGYNAKNSEKLASKYNTTSNPNIYGAALICDFDVENVEYIKFSATNKYTDAISWQLIYSNDGGNTYECLANGNSYADIMEVSLNEAISGRFALVITCESASSSRLLVTGVQINTKK